MPTVCEESGASNSTFDLQSRLPSPHTHERCTCHDLTPSGRLFGRTFSLDPGIFNRCNECHKERTRSKHVAYEKIMEDEDTVRVNMAGGSGGTKVVENRVGGTQLVHDPEKDVTSKLLNTDDEQSENDSNKKLDSCGGSDPEGLGPGPRARKPWTRRKLTLKITLTLIVIALGVAGVVLGVLNRKPEDNSLPVNQELIQQSTHLPHLPVVTDPHTHSPRRNCTLVMELDKNSISEEPSDQFKTYTLPWRTLSKSPASHAVVYSPDTMTFNVTRSGYFTLHIDVHIDTHFWIGSGDLQKTFSSVLCIHLSTGTPPKKCITNKYNSRTVNTQQVLKEVFLEKGDNFYVTIGVNTLDMIYHLPAQKNNLIEITSKKC